MLRSLYSGISGLRNHQLAMDVTSHNIANVNTTGYKSQRVTFKENLSQMLKGATRPAGGGGGTNPMQAGLGMSVGSIDTILTQGALQSTGQITDLAIEGQSYFAFSGGDGNFYSRNGAMQLDADGRMVSATNGYALQGLTAENDGTFSPQAVPDDIRIPFGEKAPAKATSEIGFQCNLDSDSAGLGTSLHTATYLHHSEDSGALSGLADSLVTLYDAKGNNLNIEDGDVLKIIYTDTVSGNEVSAQFAVDTKPPLAVGTIETIENLSDEIELLLPAGYTTAIVAGQVTVVAPAAPLDTAANLTVKNDTRPTSDPFVSNLFNWVGAVTGASAGTALSPADTTDRLMDLYNATGEPLGMENGDVVRIGGAIGGETLTADEDPTRDINGDGNPDGGLMYVDDTLPFPTGAPATTMQDLLDYIQFRLQLPNDIPNSSGSTDASVELNAHVDGELRAPTGGIMIRGQAQKAFEITGLSIYADNSNNNSLTPTAFNANMIPTEIQSARDTTVHSTSIEVFDEAGAAHTVTTTFTHSGIPNKWLWRMTTNGGEQIFGGDTGTVVFGEDGSPSSWSFNDGNNKFRFNPMNGSSEIKVGLDIGSPDHFTGITQFRSTTTTAAKEQDGYAMGKLSEITITEKGDINGVYTNGVNRTLAKILIADFANPAGLLRTGNSMYSVSNNSGEGILQAPAVGTPSVIKPGSIEMSNVDLAQEFTNLITIQRGYQANSKVISTSDELLTELVNLKR
jgi:flagellar hook protein FlgE